MSDKRPMDKERPKLDWTDALIVAGASLVCHGLSQIYVPLAWLAAGAFLFWYGLKAG